jgi:FKBP-type peptidyl-prolyl cis-trans isomerase FkpA
MKQTRHYLWLMSLLAVIVFAACKKKDNPPPFDAEKQAVIDEQLIQEYIAKNSITGTVKDTTGLHYKIIEPGTGGTKADTIQLTDRLNVSYKGTLLNGTVFDEREKETFREARLGGLVEGWQIGLQKIAKGGKVQLFIPSKLGYGNRDMGDIPANSVLVFELTLHNFYF